MGAEGWRCGRRPSLNCIRAEGFPLWTHLAVLAGGQSSSQTIKQLSSQAIKPSINQASNHTITHLAVLARRAVCLSWPT